MPTASATTRARAHLEESVAIFRALDHFWVIPRTLNTLGHVARCQGEHAHAAALYAESSRLCEEHGDQIGRAEALHNLARVAQVEGDLPRAAQLFRQALTAFHSQEQRRGTSACLAGLAGVAAMGGWVELAARLFAAAEAHRGHADLPLSPANRVDAERDLSRVKAELSASAFAAAWRTGLALGLEEAIAEALGFTLRSLPSRHRWAA